MWTCGSFYSMEPNKWKLGVTGLCILNVGRVTNCLGCLYSQSLWQQEPASKEHLGHQQNQF